MVQEQWRPAAGFKGYEVSDQGRVRSLDRLVPHCYGGVKRVRGRILKQTPDRSGRRRVALSGKTRLVHHLVLEAFVGPRPAGREGCHGDGDPSNNTLTNLRWDTHSGNMLDRVRHGNHPNTKKTHCPMGHELTDGNLRRSAMLKGHRKCLTCHRERAARIRAQRRRDAGAMERIR